MLYIALPVGGAELHIYTRDHSLSPSQLASFEQQSGHRVVLHLYTSHEQRDKHLTRHKDKYDLVLIDSVGIKRLDDHKLFAPGSFTPSRQQGFSDKWTSRCTTVGMPYAWGTMGLLYRPENNERPTSWKDLFAPDDVFAGKVVMPKDTYYAPAAALLAIGASPFSANRIQLIRAFRLMQDQQDVLMSLGQSLTIARQYGKTSPMRLTMGRSSELAPLKRLSKQVNWQYHLPKEGSLIWVDCLALTRRAAEPEAAKALVAYLSQPEIAAQSAEQMGFSTPSDAAFALLPETLQQDPVLYPSDEALSKSQHAMVLKATAVRLRYHMLKQMR